MSKLWKTLKAFSAIICIAALVLIIILNTIFAFIPEESVVTGEYGFDVRIDKDSLISTFSVSLILHLFFLVLERRSDGERSIAKNVGTVIVRASIFILALFSGEKLFIYLIESASETSSTDDEIWNVFVPIAVIVGVLVLGCIVNAAANKRESQASYYSHSTSSASTSMNTTSAPTPKSTPCVKRFSRNAWEERQGTRYVMVNCFYDNYGGFHTVDEGGFYSALERFSDENRYRYYGTASLKTYRDGVIYGSDGRHGYRCSNDWIRDGRGNTFVVRM